MGAVELAFSHLGDAIALATPCLADPRRPPKMRYGIRQRDSIGLQWACSTIARSPCKQKAAPKAASN
jgi:hypothetical protein